MRLAAAVVVLLLAAGCGGSDHSGTHYEGSYSELSGSPGPTGPSVTASGLDTSAASALASAAQQQASALPSAASIPPRTGPVLGGDVSWPQCPKGMGIAHKRSKGGPMPRSDADYVVLGLTNGPGFYPNPCLASQVQYARDRGLLVAAYSVISGPTATTLAQYGSPEKVGYAEARFNLATMKAAGLASPIIWLDVEPVPFYDWGSDKAANAEVVKGAAEGYLDAGFRIGIYSTPYLWSEVVGSPSSGGLSLGGVPEWRAAGQTSYGEALARCGADWQIQGGDGVLGQWLEDHRDRDVTCPGKSAHLGEYFARLG